MRVLLTNHELAHRTGTELLTAELAGALRLRGHEAAVFTWCRGDLAARLEASGVAVIDDPRRVPFVPDIIHGQHHLTTMAALSAWPGVPGLFFCHGVLPFDEQPPRHPRLRQYLSMAAINAEWLATAAGAPPDRVATLPNWFDPARFTGVRDRAAPATRAAFFSNRLGPGPVFEAVRAACARRGLDLAGIGRAFGAATDSPEAELPSFAVVFATGRSALEALASGCSVIPLDPVAGLGTLVTPEDFEVHRDRNWCVYQRPIEVTAQAVEVQLARLVPAAAAEVTRRVRTELTLDRAAAALEAHYGRVVAEFSKDHGADDPAAVSQETGALVDYFRFLAARTRQTDDAFLEARREARLAARVPQLREEAAAARRDLRAIVRRLQGSWWGRRFLRRHGGWQNQPPE